jgi:hypothetical protein
VDDKRDGAGVDRHVKSNREVYSCSVG